MSKGLVQMVEEATGKAPELPPVEVSDEAVRAMSAYMRQWSGWPTAMVKFGKPTLSPWAEVDQETKTFVVNADALVLNPNRVLLTITPFRLKQEAVLTGAMLHEAGHARHSHWLPKNPEEAATRPAKHSDGTDPSKQAVALARLMEEPRVEGLMFRDAKRIGADGLGWTMRASAAHVVPVTTMSKDPNRAIMDIIKSWTLRAGRQYAINAITQAAPRNWVQDFTTLLHNAVLAHLTEAEAGGADIVPAVDTRAVIDTLIEMTRVTDDTGPTMLDMARDVLALLFPETDPDDMPEGDDPHGEEKGDAAEESESESEKGDDGEGDEEGEGGEGNTEPEDEGSGDEPGAGDSGQDDAEPDKADDAEPGKTDDPTTDTGEDGEAESDEAEPGEDESDQPGDGGATSSTDAPTEEGEDSDDGEGADTDSPLAKALADMEREAKAQTTDEVEEEEEQETEAIGSGAGLGDGNGSWRTPTKTEREMQVSAEKFLRELISPSEATKVTLTESPSATVDAAALSAWKAGGQVRDPRFFRRTRRTIEPSPPVRIAILVDVSISMSQLQKPSAQLSWALGAAALDLRNFAGRGQQVESCMVHWGTEARVIQRNGEMLPGLREWSCNEGTTAMAEACELVEEQMPGFFDTPERPTNRLLVQFTDWELGWEGQREATEYVQRALAGGVNMLTIAPEHYSERRYGRRDPRSELPAILAKCEVLRGTSSVTRYNRMFPEQAWEDAAKMLEL